MNHRYDNLKLVWGVRQQRSVRRHSKCCGCSEGPTQGTGRRAGGGVGFWNGSSHLGSHCEQGLPFWWRLTWYLLQDHGNSLICSPRVFPLQQWNHCVRTVGQLSAVKPTHNPHPGHLTEQSLSMKHCDWSMLFPQDYGNEERVTEQCGGLIVDSDEDGGPQHGNLLIMTNYHA